MYYPHPSSNLAHNNNGRAQPTNTDNATQLTPAPSHALETVVHNQRRFGYGTNQGSLQTLEPLHQTQQLPVSFQTAYAQQQQAYHGAKFRRSTAVLASSFPTSQHSQCQIPQHEPGFEPNLVVERLGLVSGLSLYMKHSTSKSILFLSSCM